MLGDLLRLIRTQGPLQWELAFQLATSVAAGDEPDPNPDPIARIRLEELSGIAELHVADVTGTVLAAGSRGPKLVPTTRVEWARRSLEGWRPLLDHLAAALTSTGEKPPQTSAGAPGSSGPIGFGPPPGPGSGEGGPSAPLEGDELPLDPFLGEEDLLKRADEPREETEDAGDLAEMIGRWTSAMAPTMAAMQVGSVVGHLARRSLGQYDLPLPRTASNEILVAACNMDRFAAEWSLPIDDLRLWLCAHEMAFHAVLSRPQVAKRLEELVIAHARLVRPDPRDLEGLLQGIDPGSIPGLSQVIGDPSLLGYSEDGGSPELDRVRAQLAALTAAIAGYTEWVTSVVRRASSGVRHRSARPCGVAESAAARASTWRSPCSACISTRKTWTAEPPSCKECWNVPTRSAWRVFGPTRRTCRPRRRSTPRGSGWHASTWRRAPRPLRHRCSTASAEHDLFLGHSEVPLQDEVLALGIADDPLPVSPELWVVGRQEHERASARWRNSSITARSPNSDSTSQWGATGPR